jgi:hypothetical protein
MKITGYKLTRQVRVFPKLIQKRTRNGKTQALGEQVLAKGLQLWACIWKSVGRGFENGFEFTALDNATPLRVLNKRMHLTKE